jgi:hypothetical protein
LFSSDFSQLAAYLALSAASYLFSWVLCYFTQSYAVLSYYLTFYLLSSVFTEVNQSLA